MNDMSASMRAPWYHYVGAMLIGWAMAAFMYTYQRIRTLFCGSPLTEGTFHFTNFSILQPRSLFQHFHSMDFLPPFQPFPRYSTGRCQSCKNYIDRAHEPTRSPQLDCKQDIFVLADQPLVILSIFRCPSHCYDWMLEELITIVFTAYRFTIIIM